MRERTRLIIVPVIILCPGTGRWIGNHLYGPYTGPGIDWPRVAIAAIDGGIGAGLTLGLDYLVARKRHVNCAVRRSPGVQASGCRTPGNHEGIAPALHCDPLDA